MVTVVMQACYWSRRTLPTSARHRHGVVLGHVLLFLSRLAFVFAGSTFALLVVRVTDTRTSVQGAAAVLLALFSIFCYVLDLEQMARSNLDPSRTS
jgi:hypothetical protein